MLDLIGDAAVELNASLMGSGTGDGLELGLEGGLDHLNGDLFLLAIFDDLLGNNGSL